MNLIHGMIGLLILTLGRRLFWLFVGCLGFVAGLQMAELYFASQPLWLAWAVALLFGLIGALLALFFQGVAILFGGFAAGSTIAAYLTVFVGFTVNPLTHIIGGILGAIILFALFDWALIGLSSLVGATLIIEIVSWSTQFETVLYPVLVGIGIVVQTLLWHRQKSETK